jgi:hypothetical protein
MARQNSAMLFAFRGRTLWQSFLAFAACLFACTLAAAACNFPVRQPTPTPSPIPSATPLPTVEVTEQPARLPSMPYDDAGSVLAGLCFGFLQTLSNHTLVVDSAADLAKLYDAVDASKQCRGAVERKPFDFSARQIVGFVAVGTGCSLDVIYDRTELDESAHQRTIVFQSRIDGDCPYDLVRPLWLAVERQGYTTQIRIATPS